MKTILLALAALAIATAPTLAKGTPPTAEQKQQFYDACTVYGTPDLCQCKADAAMTLIDTTFMAVVIAAMRGTDPPPDLNDTYSDYIARSTEACGMGSAM